VFGRADAADAADALVGLRAGRLRPAIGAGAAAAVLALATREELVAVAAAESGALRAAHVRLILGQLPPVLQAGLATWRLRFSTANHGTSMTTLNNNLHPRGGGCTHTLLVVATTSGELFGGYASSAWREPSREPHFYGSGECFLWRFEPADAPRDAVAASFDHCAPPAPWPCTASCAVVGRPTTAVTGEWWGRGLGARREPELPAFDAGGAGDGGQRGGLWPLARGKFPRGVAPLSLLPLLARCDVATLTARAQGSTGPTSTFGNPPLCRPNHLGNNTCRFQARLVEVWDLDPL
jgi:hypothetical protein